MLQLESTSVPLGYLGAKSLPNTSPARLAGLDRKSRGLSASAVCADGPGRAEHLANVAETGAEPRHGNLTLVRGRSALQLPCRTAQTRRRMGIT